MTGVMVVRVGQCTEYSYNNIISIEPKTMKEQKERERRASKQICRLIHTGVEKNRGHRNKK